MYLRIYLVNTLLVDRSIQVSCIQKSCILVYNLHFSSNFCKQHILVLLFALETHQKKSSLAVTTLRISEHQYLQNGQIYTIYYATLRLRATNISGNRRNSQQMPKTRSDAKNRTLKWKKASMSHLYRAHGECLSYSI